MALTISTMLLIQAVTRDEVDREVARMTAGEWEVWTGTDLNRDQGYEAILIHRTPDG